jgi:hypothetical protein
MLSRDVSQIFFGWFLDGFSCPCYSCYHFCFYIPHALYFYCKIFIYLSIFSDSLLITFLYPEMRPLLTYTFVSDYHRLWCRVFCWEWFCKFSLVHSTILLRLLHEVFLIFVCDHMNAPYFFASVSLDMSKCSRAYTLSCHFMYCSFANIRHADITCSLFSSYCWYGPHMLFLWL